MEQSWTGAHPARAVAQSRLCARLECKASLSRLKLVPSHSSPLLKVLRNPMHTHLLCDAVPAGTGPLLDDRLI